MTLLAHQERLIAEQVELADRIEKLAYFVGGNPAFHALSDADRDRLRRQLSAMSQYDAILRERIGAFA